MAQATDLNTSTPMADRSQLAMQMEGLTIATLYVLCFGWLHLHSGVEFLSVRVFVSFFAGLIAVPLVTGFPIVFIRRTMMNAIRSQPSIAAFATFAHLALYALQGILVWVVTREGYDWAFTNVPPL
jgi:hypothetical protein